MLPGPSWLRAAHDAGKVTGAHARETDDLWVPALAGPRHPDLPGRQPGAARR